MEGRIISYLERGETEEVLALLQDEPRLRQTVVGDGRTLLQLALQYDNEQLAGHLLDGLEEGGEEGNKGIASVHLTQGLLTDSVAPC